MIRTVAGGKGAHAHRGDGGKGRRHRSLIHMHPAGRICLRPVQSKLSRKGLVAVQIGTVGEDALAAEIGAAPPPTSKAGHRNNCTGTFAAPVDHTTGRKPRKRPRTRPGPSVGTGAPPTPKASRTSPKTPARVRVGGNLSENSAIPRWSLLFFCFFLRLYC